MYPATFKEKFPTGLGYEWTSSGNYLKKSLLTNEKISLGSIEWLDYMQNDQRLINSSGVRSKIIFGWNSREVKIGPYRVDGYALVDQQCYIFEYNGCFHHGCDLCGYQPRKVISLKIICVNYNMFPGLNFRSLFGLIFSI